MNVPIRYRGGSVGEGEDELAAMIEKSGRLSCPIVYVGEVLIGGASETIAAYESGELLRLVESR